MKKFSLFLMVIFLISIGSSFQQVTAQEKTKEEQEKEKKIQQEIDQQKKTMAEQKKAMADAVQNLKEQNENEDKERTKLFMNLPRGNRSFSFDEPFEFNGRDMNTFLRHTMGDDSESTTLDFSKSVKDNTFSRDYTFDVDKTVKSVVMSVMGDCKSGDIRIKIIMPNGKNYSDILIDESGNLNWRKSFTITEKENMDKTGEWKLQISSTRATGFFKIALQAY